MRKYHDARVTAWVTGRVNPVCAVNRFSACDVTMSSDDNVTVSAHALVSTRRGSELRWVHKTLSHLCLY